MWNRLTPSERVRVIITFALVSVVIDAISVFMFLDNPTLLVVGLALVSPAISAAIGFMVASWLLSRA